MFINSENKNPNSISDEELEINQKEESKKAAKKEKKAKKNTEGASYSKLVESEPVPVKQAPAPAQPQAVVDYKKRRKREKRLDNLNDLLGIFKTIFVFALVAYLIMYFGPKVFKFNDDNKQEYVNRVKGMVSQIVDYYDQDNLKCTTTTKDTYYFNLGNSNETFGRNYKSPFINSGLQGYVEFDVESNGSYEVYASFTDGLFGFERVKVSELEAKDIKVYTYLSIDRHPEMVCNKEFVNSK